MEFCASKFSQISRCNHEEPGRSLFTNRSYEPYFSLLSQRVASKAGYFDVINKNDSTCRCGSIATECHTPRVFSGGDINSCVQTLARMKTSKQCVVSRRPFCTRFLLSKLRRQSCSKTRVPWPRCHNERSKPFATHVEQNSRTELHRRTPARRSFHTGHHNLSLTSCGTNAPNMLSLVKV